MSTLSTVQRDALVYNASFIVANSAYFGYELVRPLKFYTKGELEITWNPPSVELPVAVNEFDCSGSIMQLYFMSGCKDPGGFNFSGYGNSETMLAHLKHYTNAKDAHPGAIAVFGANLPLGEQHVVMVWEMGADPIVFSHGQPGAKLLKLSDEAKAHLGASITFLDVSPLG